jgi:3-oxoacyl-[acyl-carrier protein] reductase
MKPGATALTVMPFVASSFASDFVNAINPGPVQTERWDQLIRGIAKMRGISVEEAQQRAERSIPLGRICTPEEVANVAVFVASERASFMNGALITLDGGQRKALLE